MAYYCSFQWSSELFCLCHFSSLPSLSTFSTVISVWWPWVRGLFRYDNLCCTMDCYYWLSSQDAKSLSLPHTTMRATCRLFCSQLSLCDSPKTIGLVVIYSHVNRSFYQGLPLMGVEPQPPRHPRPPSSMQLDAVDNASCKLTYQSWLPSSKERSSSHKRV